jgi:hypothetical protein
VGYNVQPTTFVGTLGSGFTQNSVAGRHGLHQLPHSPLREHATLKVKVRLRLHHYICLKGHPRGSLEKACNLTYVNKGEASKISKRKRRNKGLGWRRKGDSRMA